MRPADADSSALLLDILGYFFTVAVKYTDNGSLREKGLNRI